MKFQCVYCRSEISKNYQKTVICTRCKTHHHLECWLAYDGCSVFGCANKIKPVYSVKILRCSFLTAHSSTIIFLYAVALFLFSRVSLFLLLSSVICVFLLNRIVPYFQKVLFVLYCLSLLLILLPIDVRIQNRGTITMRIIPISWGYPSTKGEEEIAHDRLIRGGCMIPLNPASHALVLTY